MGWQEEEDIRRKADLAFLERIRDTDIVWLKLLRMTYHNKDIPEWRKIAIDRAILRWKSK